MSQKLNEELEERNRELTAFRTRYGIRTRSEVAAEQKKSQQEQQQQQQQGVLA